MHKMFQTNFARDCEFTRVPSFQSVGIFLFLPFFFFELFQILCHLQPYKHVEMGLITLYKRRIQLVKEQA